MDRHGTISASPHMEARDVMPTGLHQGATSMMFTDTPPSTLARGLSGQDGPTMSSLEPRLDLDVTVLAFAQWVSEMKSRQHNMHHQMQAEMSMIRNTITPNHTDLVDFKRHGAAIQQQMQCEINEIRESLSNVFKEITNAVRNNAAADQGIKLKIQSLNEQAVRNETAFAQLADAADQSQSNLRNAVQEMQSSSERMRDELGTLTRHAESMETIVGDRAERINTDVAKLTEELHVQLERKREHLKKMVNDVVSIGESLQHLVLDFSEQRKAANDVQNKLQNSLYVLDQTSKKKSSSVASRGLATATDTPQLGHRYTPHMQQRPSSIPGQVTAVQSNTRPMPMTNVMYR